MNRKYTIILFLITVLLLSSICCVSAIPNQTDDEETIVKLEARGGIPGRPDKPTDPPDPPPDPDVTYELTVEIDYFENNEPTASVLTYIEDYYAAENVVVTFILDGPITDLALSTLVDSSDGINDAEYWAIEGEYNDGADQAGDGYDFTLKEKWVLYGNKVEGSDETVGYALGILAVGRNPRKADFVAANYVFIADENIEGWAGADEQMVEGAEAVVLMHELGHCIGIAKVGYSRFSGYYEIYDPDSASVMSYLSVDNAGLYGNWYYSSEYWDTRNMDYYEA